MSKGLNVHSEIGKLKKVVLHRPGRDLVNVKAEEFEDVWIHDCFYLDVAQKEHDAFADLLKSEGVEVLYMEKLVAEALDSCPSARAEFTDTLWLRAGLSILCLSRLFVKSSTLFQIRISLYLRLWGGIVIVTLSCLASRLRLV